MWQLLGPEASGKALGNSRRLAAFCKKAGPSLVSDDAVWGYSVVRGGGRGDESQPEPTEVSNLGGRGDELLAHRSAWGGALCW